MKKFLLSIAWVMTCGSIVFAQETVKELYSGNPVNVTWENTMKFDSKEFEDIHPGDYIYITFSATTDVIELKSDGQWLPGTRFSWLGEGVPDYRSYITEDGLASLQEFGLELCGANFTVSGVSICNDGFVMPSGAVWGGYFWVDNWNTLEIWKTAFSNYNGEKYMIINISEDNADNTEYVMQVMTKFDDEAAVIGNAGKGNETKTEKFTVIDLSEIDLSSMLETTDRVLVQGNPEGGNPFNITSVVISNTNPLDPNGVESIFTFENEFVDVYNIQGITLKNSVLPSEALYNLPKGIYIIKGKNTSKKIVK